MRVRPRPLQGRPTVSVVIPCYKYGHFLPDCLGSVLAQDEVDLEVVIIDDASPDGSAAVARELAAGDPRVRVIEHAKNTGHIAANNEGLRMVDGEFVVVLDADDMLTPGSFGRSVALLQAFPEVAMVYGFARTFVDTRPPPRLDLRSWSIWPGTEWLERVFQNGGNPVATPEVMMRAETSRRLAGYDPRMPHTSDFLLWLRAAAHGPIGRINGVDQAFYRVHGQNMSIKQFGGALTDLIERRRAFELFFDEDGKALPEAERLRDTAIRSLACEALVTACGKYERGISEPEGEIAERLVAFAVDTHPAASDSNLRRRVEKYARRASAGKGPLVPPAITAIQNRVRGHIEWRRFRRTGVESAVKLT